MGRYPDAESLIYNHLVAAHRAVDLYTGIDSRKLPIAMMIAKALAETGDNQNATIGNRCRQGFTVKLRVGSKYHECI